MSATDQNGTHSSHGKDEGGDKSASFEIPKEGKAGCVVDNGPNFRVEIENVPVPEPGELRKGYKESQ